MSIIINGLTTARNSSISAMINNVLTQKQQSLGSLYQQKAAIEDMFNQVASGAYTTGSEIYQLNSYYNSQIINLQSTINTISSQINTHNSKITTLNSLKNQYSKTVTSLDDFLKSVKDSTTTSGVLDFTNTNPDVVDVVLNGNSVNTQKIDYKVTQVATATKAISDILKGENISLNTKITDLYAGNYSGTRVTTTRNDLDESMTMSQLGIKSGVFNIGNTSISVNSNTTLGDVINALQADGYGAGIENGQFYIDSKGVKSMNLHDQSTNFGEKTGLTISTGTFSINGNELTIDSNTTINDLFTEINGDEKYGVGAILDENKITLVANRTGNVLIEIAKGSSNFTNVIGFTTGGKMIEDNLVLGSDGSVQVLSGSNSIAAINGGFEEGSFVIRKTLNGVTAQDVINVAAGDTIDDVIAKINASSLDITAAVENDRFVIKNNVKGAGYSITVESGNSDFTSKVGLTDKMTSTGVLNPELDAQYFTTLTGIKNIVNPSNVQVTAGSFKINDTTIEIDAGTLAAAIEKINDYTDQTGVIAEFDADNGHVVLRNKMTGSEGLFVEGGTSNFGAIAGFTTESSAAAAATIGQLGSKTTLTGSEKVDNSTMVEDSTINLNGTLIDISAGTLQSAINQINAKSDITQITASIENDRLVFTEMRNGSLPISVTDISGNFGQTTGIIGYQVSAGQEEKYGSSKTTFTATKTVSNSDRILDSVVTINGKDINLSGTISSAISTINANSAATGVEAFIDGNGKFVLRNTNAGSAGISFAVQSGDFGRVVGTGTYTTVTGTNSHVEKEHATVTGAITGLDEYSQVLAGSKIQFGSVIIDLGASVGAALLAINTNKDITGVEALLNDDGQFVLRAVSDTTPSISFKIIGVGDFGRVTGLGSYTVGAAPSNGEHTNYTYSKLVGQNTVSKETEITESQITLGFVNDAGVNVEKTFLLKDGTLEDAMNTINSENWYVKAEIVNDKLQFVSRDSGPFRITLSVDTVNGVTGDFGRVAGMASSTTLDGSISHLRKDPAKYVGATSGLNSYDELIGTNSIKLWMSRSNSYTGVNTEQGSGALASVAQTITFTDKDGNGYISVQDAIDSINDLKHVTKIEALLENGQFVLRQTDANTAGEGDTINFEVSGDGDFARVAGFGDYTTIGQADTGNVVGQSYTTLTGSRDVDPVNEVLESTFKFTITKADAQNSAGINMSVDIQVSDGTLADAITSINQQLAAAGISVTASITNGKFEFKSDIAGDYNISVDMTNSDFGRVIGIGTHTTTDGSYTVREKQAAKVTGGVTGLKYDSQLTGSVQLTLQGIITSTTTGVNTEGGTNNAVSSVKTITLSGTIEDAINAINAETSTTQIRAYLDADGRFVLEQTNANTASEFDTISFSVSGTGDFGAVTGLSAYIAYGDDNTGTTTGQIHSYISGVVDNLKGTEQVTDGKVTITLVNDVHSWNTPVTTTFDVDITGTVQNVAEQITARAQELGLELEAYIDPSNGRFTIKSTSYGPDSISIGVQGSDFGRIAGIANYTLDFATVTGGNSTYELHPTLSGGNEVTGDITIISGTLQIGGNTINTTNKTIEQIVNEVNNLGLAGVTADLETGYFRIKMLENTVDNPLDIQATGDFARVTGFASYSVGSATYVDGSYTVSDGTHSFQTKSEMGLNKDTTFVGGSITITHDDGYGQNASFTIDTTGKTVEEVVAEINAAGQSGPSVDSVDGYSKNYVYAEYVNEQIVIKTNYTNHSITADGDFARVTGFSAYTSGVAQNFAPTTTVENGTFEYLTQNKNKLTADTTFVNGTISISFENGSNGTRTITVNGQGKALSQVLSELQTQADAYGEELSKDGYVISKPEITFDQTTGKISIKTYGNSHTVSATGDMARLTGFGNYTVAMATNTPGGVSIINNKYVYTDGSLTGSVNVYDSNGSAIANQAGFLEFYSGTEKIGFVKVDAGDNLQAVLNKINSTTLTFDVPDDLPGENVSYKLNAVIDSSGRIKINYCGAISDFSVKGDSAFASYYGLTASGTSQYEDYDTAITPSKDIVTYDRNGVLTGATDLSEVNGNAIFGQEGTIDFYNGSTKIASVTVGANDDLQTVLNKINSMTVNYAPPSDVSNVNWDTTISAQIVNDRIEITYGAGMDEFRVSGSSAFVYFYGLGENPTELAQRSVNEEIDSPKDVYIYNNGSITGSVSVNGMITDGTLAVGKTNIGPFSGQKDGMLTFVTQTADGYVAVGNVEILATDGLDAVMKKINDMIAKDIITPNGVEINKINGYTASFTADGKIQITYGGQLGAVRIQDTSGFAQYYGLTDASTSWQDTSFTGTMERPMPDKVGESTVTSANGGYKDTSVVGSLQGGTFRVSINGKNVDVHYNSNESIETIMNRLVELANQKDGTGLFDFNTDAPDLNMLPLTEDKLTYRLDSDGHIVITSAVESRTQDKLVITDLSGNFASLTGIATEPEGYTPPVFPGAPTEPGITNNGTDYFVKLYEETGSHGSFSFTGSSINGLTANTALSGITDGGFNINTTDGAKWIEVHAGDTVQTVLDRINALNSSINAVFDAKNNRISITATDNALYELSFTDDTSGFVQRAGLAQDDVVYDANFTSTKLSDGLSKLKGSTDNLHATHVLGNIQGGLNTAQETVTISGGGASVNITVTDDESLDSIIQKIKDTGEYDAGIEDGRFWIKSLTDSSVAVTVSESNFARILGLSGESEELGEGTLTLGSFGTMEYTSAAIDGLLGSSDLTIDDSIAGDGDGSFRITLSDKTNNTINVAAKSFDVEVGRNMTVNDIVNAIKTSALNAGIEGFNITFDNSTHQFKISIAGNKAEQITFSGLDARGRELVKRLGLSTASETTTHMGTFTEESHGYLKLTGSVDGLHGEHVLGGLNSSTFTISDGSSSVTISVTNGQSLNEIINNINIQSGGKYTASIDSNGRFFIQANSQNAQSIIVSESDFTTRVGLVGAAKTEGASAQTEVGDHGLFVFYGAGGSGGTGIDGMKGSTVFTGLKNGSFTFTLGETTTMTPNGDIVYRPKRSYTVNVSSSDSVDTILNKMKQAIINAESGYQASDVTGSNRLDTSAMVFKVDVDDTTGKGRIHIELNGEYASEITFQNDSSGFVTMAGMSTTGATTDADFTATTLTSGKSMLTGSMQNLDADHVFGGMQAGTLILTAGSVTETVNVSATDRIQDVIDKINQNGNFEAGMDENGALYIKTTGQNSADLIVSGTSDFHKLTGLTGNTWSAAGVTDNGSYGLSKITGSVSGLSAGQSFNNMTAGSFSISAAGHRTLNVNVEKGVTTIQDVLDFINSSTQSDYRASLNSSGQIEITTTIENGATIRIDDGDTDYARILGLTAGTIGGEAVGVTGQQDVYSTLTGSRTGLNSGITFSAGDFEITVKNPDGTVKTHTFNLAGGESLAEIAAQITNSDLGITAEIDPYGTNLVLKAKLAGAYEISLKDGTSNFAEVTGFTQSGAQIQSAQNGVLSTLTSSKTAQNASLLGYTSGDFFISLTDKNGNITDTRRIEISSGDTVQEIAAAITASGIGITAGIDATTGKMVLTRDSSETDGGIAITKGTSDFTNKIGFTSGGTLSQGAQTVSGTDATSTVIKSDRLQVSNDNVLLSTLGVAAGNFKINNTVITVSETDTIANLVNKINGAFLTTDENGVRAEFIDNRIVLTSNAKKTNARIQVEAGSSNLTDIVGFTNGNAMNIATQQNGYNAIFNLNGTDYETESNVIKLDKNGKITADDAAAAITITIKETGTGTINIGSLSLDETYMKLLDFVGKFNVSMTLSQSTNIVGDAEFTALLGRIRDCFTSDIGNRTDIQEALADIGIVVNMSGSTASPAGRVSITVNRDEFYSAFLSNPQNVSELLIGDDTGDPIDHTVAGAFVRVKDTLDDSLKPVSGYFNSTIRTLTSQRNALKDELSISKGQLARFESELSLYGGDEALAQSQKELMDFLSKLQEQYSEINDLITKLNRQYNESLTRVIINQNNPGFNPIV